VARWRRLKACLPRHRVPIATPMLGVGWKAAWVRPLQTHWLDEGLELEKTGTSFLQVCLPLLCMGAQACQHLPAPI
jgi:hypothetical protein